MGGANMESWGAAGVESWEGAGAECGRVESVEFWEGAGQKAGPDPRRITGKDKESQEWAGPELKICRAGGGSGKGWAV